MRLRNVKGAKEEVAKSPFVISEPQSYKGKWNELFSNEHPIHIEIGMGKGQFIHALAKENPHINYIGIEKYDSVLVRALAKREEYEGNNLFLLCFDAQKIEDIFETGEIEKIYLNFSDPWPKDRHAKRRLTSIPFLNRYNQILSPKGDIEFKTDNVLLFDFSLEQIEEAGWKTRMVTRHLHENGPAPDNIMTEYEEKFYNLGNPIQKLIAYRDFA